MTPVIVALVSEGLRHPAEKITVATSSVARRARRRGAVRAAGAGAVRPPAADRAGRAQAGRRSLRPARAPADPPALAPGGHHRPRGLPARRRGAHDFRAGVRRRGDARRGDDVLRRQSGHGGDADADTGRDAGVDDRGDAYARRDGDPDGDAAADRHTGRTGGHSSAYRDPVMAKDKIPTSRVARTARVSGLAAGQAARHLGTRAANLARTEDGRQAALERRNLEAAGQIVAALGTMKGAAMKLGQVMSFLDVGLVPEEYREEFQRKLGELRDAAPKVRFTDMRKVMECEYGESIDDVFEAFDPEPIAAASIGQVYRARAARRPRRGRQGPVPGRRPGGAGRHAEPRDDPALMERIAPGLDVKSTAEEIRARIGEELDYELEAQHQRALSRIFRGHPFIRVPEVVTSLSRERVLVSEYVTASASRRSRSSTRRRATASPRSSSASSSAACTATASSPATRTRATSCCARRLRRVPGLRSLQADAARADRDRAGVPARRRRGRRRAAARDSAVRGSCASPKASGPTSCWPSSSTPRGGT